MSKPIVCLTCEKALVGEDGCTVFKNKYDPHWICYNLIEWWQLEELGRLWLKNKNKFVKNYLKALSLISELEEARAWFFKRPKSFPYINDDYIRSD